MQLFVNRRLRLPKDDEPTETMGTPATSIESGLLELPYRLIYVAYDDPDCVGRAAAAHYLKCQRNRIRAVRYESDDARYNRTPLLAPGEPLPDDFRQEVTILSETPRTNLNIGWNRYIVAIPVTRSPLRRQVFQRKIHRLAPSLFDGIQVVDDGTPLVEEEVEQRPSSSFNGWLQAQLFDAAAVIANQRRQRLSISDQRGAESEQTMDSPEEESCDARCTMEQTANDTEDDSIRATSQALHTPENPRKEHAEPRTQPVYSTYILFPQLGRWISHELLSPTTEQRLKRMAEHRQSIEQFIAEMES